MSDDQKTPPPSPLSSTQGTANLDDVLSSLEKQLPQDSATPAPVDPVSPPSPTPPVTPPEPMPPLTPVEEKPVEPVPPVIPPAPEPMASAASTPTPPPVPTSSSFGIEENHIEPVATPVPVATPEQSPVLTETLREHPMVATQTTTTTAPPPRKKGLFGIDPKLIVGAAVVFILAIGSVAAYLTIGAPAGSLDTRNQASGCSIVYNQNTFTLTNCVGSGTITRFNGPSCPTTQNKVSEVPATDGTISPQPPAGQCQQVDHNFGGNGPDGLPIGAGGVCSCNSAPSPTPQPRACGEACTTTANCRNPSTGGFPVECRNGKCQLPLTGPYACPEGQSSGSICTCAAKVQCGQQCGPAAGGKLCNPGSVCGFLTPSNACKVNGVDQSTKQYCIPVNPNGGYSSKRCDTTPAINYIAADSLVKPDGTQTNLTAADAVVACTPVCGDKIVAGNEECDAGSENGKPGSTCDATCKMRNVCGDTCSAASECNKHYVTLRCSVGATGTTERYCGLDAIVENGVTIEENSTRFIKPGMWRISSTAALSGGSEIYDHEQGATISFWTSATNVTLVYTKASNRGTFNILVDGKQQSATINQNGTTTQYKQNALITVRDASIPEYVCTSNTCRLSTSPESPTCDGNIPSPSPTPSAPPLACLRISSDNPTPVLGSQVRFTCGLVTGVDRYEFRYKMTFNGVDGAGGTLAATNNLSAPLTVDQPGDYKAQCRPCVGQACAPWQNW
ncbi:MAG: hypothetical protein ABI758_02885 [Candidatus Woesebacteria bacterium]